MSKFVVVSFLVIATAVLLGYVGGAVMATGVGRTSLAIVACLIVIVGILESGQMSSRTLRT